jgi:hypothetical protein
VLRRPTWVVYFWLGGQESPAISAEAFCSFFQLVVVGHEPVSLFLANSGAGESLCVCVFLSPKLCVEMG